MTNAESPIIDETDKKIIGLLFEDARMHLSKIGKAVGLSKNAVWTRYENMCKKGVITGSTVQINYKKLGYDAVAQLLLSVDPSKVEGGHKLYQRKNTRCFWTRCARFKI